MDLSVRPQDDFFRYVNGKWADNTPIPADQSGYGSFAMLRERAQERVRAIIEDEARRASAPGSIGQKVGDFYESYMDESRIDSLGITPLKGELAAIAAITDKRDLPKAFARAARVGVRLPFSVGVGVDQRNSEEYAVQISQSGLGMPIATITCAPTRSSRRPARRMRPTSHGSSPSAISPIRRAPRRALPRSKRRSQNCSGIARATAIVAPPTTR